MAAITIVDDVVLKEQEGDAFLLHVPSGRYFGLNRSGLVIWEALRTGADPVAALGERWPAVPETQRRNDVDTLIEALLASGLVESSGESPAS
jgi:hypothetical protein